MKDNKINLAVNFFIGVTLLNETIDEVLDTQLFVGKDKQKGKNLLNYFTPVEEKLFEAFKIKKNTEEEMEFQQAIKNMGEVFAEIAYLHTEDIQVILKGIKDYKKEIESKEVEEITT